MIGEFIAHLHDSGVYFRGLDMGNVVLTSSDDFGLIVILKRPFIPIGPISKDYETLQDFGLCWRTNSHLDIRCHE